MHNTPNPDNYLGQLEEKKERFLSLFDGLITEPEIYTSPPLNYRMRAEFRIWHEGGQAYYAINNPGEKTPYIIDDFPIASVKINTLMPSLLAAINQNTLLKKRLFTIEFLTTLSGEALITLIYHRPLDDAWEAAARQLQSELATPIIGRSKKQKRVLDRDFVTEQLTVDGKAYHYRQIENSFTQPNAAVNQQMLSWALAQTKHVGGDLLELYCGNGNFTCVLSHHFNRVLATEISKTSVAAAQHNLEKNLCKNTTVVRLSSEELTQALNKDREFRRLKEKKVDLDSYQFSTLFVDPPRAGLDSGTLSLASTFTHILYISCNPATLHENILALQKSHYIERVAIFDQFPYTEHLEAGVLLTKRS